MDSVNFLNWNSEEQQAISGLQAKEILVEEDSATVMLSDWRSFVDSFQYMLLQSEKHLCFEGIVVSS